MSNDVGGSAIGKILGWIGSLFGLFTGKVSAAIKYAFEGLRQAVVGLGEELATFIGDLRNFLSKIVGLLKRFATGILAPFLRWIRERFLWLKDWLLRVFGPVLRVLQFLHDHILSIYKNIIRPILDVIDTIRFGLQLLKKLGVKWAGTLDTVLGEWESWITERYLEVLGAVNKAQNILDSIVTGDLLFQQFPFLASLKRDAPKWAVLFWNAHVVGHDAAKTAALKGSKYDLNDPASYGTQLGEFYATGGGPLAPKIRELVPLWSVASGTKSR